MIADSKVFFLIGTRYSKHAKLMPETRPKPSGSSKEHFMNSKRIWALCVQQFLDKFSKPADGQTSEGHHTAHNKKTNRNLSR